MLLGLHVAALLLTVQFTHRHFTFDDAYISYRYARNLASGYGITWNPGEPPVEGYTNFLLVVLLAPFLRWGFDPLGVTRCLSLVSAGGLVLLAFVAARRYAAADRFVASVMGLALVPSSMTAFVATTGLETVLFAFFFFASFLAGAELVERPTARRGLLFGLSQIAAFLLRPEALFLSLAVLAVLAFDRTRSGPLLPAGLAFAASFGAPLALYLGWKLAHFGDLLPTSFYLKASPGGTYSPLGLQSVFLFAKTHWKLLALVLASSFLAVPARRPRRLAAAVAVLYAAFYVRVDTLMDVYQRFLYPITPVVFFLALPASCRMVSAIRRAGLSPWARYGAIWGVFVLVLHAPLGPFAAQIAALVRGVDPFGDEASLMRQEERIARRLAEFPGIEDLHIALGDAGVIPYFTGARILDAVGINDRTISRGGELGDLVDYFFSLRPDLVLFPAGDDFSPISYGHGPLGEVRKWAFDPRWSDYDYAGTVPTRGEIYDLHFLVRRSFPRREALTAFLAENVVDVVHDPFPLALGAAE